MKSFREQYGNVITTLMCALVIWFGTQVSKSAVELAEVRTEILFLRKEVTENKQAQEYIHKDFEYRLRKLELDNAKQE